jgi:ketosteroid isomerase-like protein
MGRSIEEQPIVNDYEAIRRLLADYCFGTDTGDTDRWTGCFADDIVWDGGAFGRFEGLENARAYHRSAGDGSKNFRHVNTNAVIDIEGESATVRSYIQVYDQSGPTPAIAFSGFYDDRLVKRGGRWLIRMRRLVSDVAEIAPVRP